MVLRAIADRGWLVRANPVTLCLDCVNAQFVRKAYSSKVKTYCGRAGVPSPVTFVVVECSEYKPRTPQPAGTRVCGFGCSGCSRKQQAS
jgi:hypothetical protein